MFIFLIITNPIFSNLLMINLENEFPPRQIDTLEAADGIVVLSGMIGQIEKNGVNIIEWGRPNRYFAGIELYRSGKAPKLFFTGGSTPIDPEGFLEGEFLKKKAIIDGIPPQNIFVTDISYNTEQEAISLTKVLYKKNIILVTSSFHMNRAKFIFESYGYNVHPFPVDFMSTESKLSIMHLLPSVDALSKIDLYIRENIGRIFYNLKYGAFK